MCDSARLVRYVRHAVRDAVRHQTRAVIGLCGMCGSLARLLAWKLNSEQRACAFPHVRASMPHIPHIPHTRQFTRVSACFMPHNPSAHTAHTFVHPLFWKRGEEVEEKVEGRGVMQCSQENVGEFNTRLRAELPEFYALARAFHSLGMIDGLRGASIGPAGSLGSGGVVPELSGAAEERLKAKRLAEGVRG
ncbi:hypothetical protein E6C76_20245 [Pseudothauera nasutitermitis]|uniref:Uncharacterized protein n=1 Tax=Pseudothauera nasutitermitis TaxID=2565930 RepID=A0A4S4ASC8_9RHOO|nr:hypothetical protein [Pseudothauera nasutitermitis]THF61414.1 hypothetical protein E6C76_20245 [Pseudothauera nasutitermitis]